MPRVLESLGLEDKCRGLGRWDLSSALALHPYEVAMAMSSVKPWCPCKPRIRRRKRCASLSILDFVEVGAAEAWDFATRKQGRQLMT